MISEPHNFHKPEDSIEAGHFNPGLSGTLANATGSILQTIQIAPSLDQLTNILPETRGVLEKFTDQFNRGIQHQKNIFGLEEVPLEIQPLQIIAGGSLGSALEQARPIFDDKNNIIACDADGVFISQWIRVWREIKKVYNDTVQENHFENIHEGFDYIRKYFDAFVAGFDLEGLEQLEHLNKDGIVSITTDRRQKLLGVFPWFGTPLITKLFEDLNLGIPVIAHSQRAKGGSAASIRELFDYIAQQVERIDPTKEINVTLISDILNKNILLTPPTKKSDSTGGEGKFLARLTMEMYQLLKDIYGTSPNIQPVYVAINNSFLAYSS